MEQPPRLLIVEGKAGFLMWFRVVWSAIECLKQSPVEVGPDLLQGGMAVLGDLLDPLYKICIACLNAAAGLAE